MISPSIIALHDYQVLVLLSYSQPLESETLESLPQPTVDSNEPRNNRANEPVIEEKTTCDACIDDHKPAVCYCCDCDKKLCNEHQKVNCYL